MWFCIFETTKSNSKKPFKIMIQVHVYEIRTFSSRGVSILRKSGWTVLRDKNLILFTYNTLVTMVMTSCILGDGLTIWCIWQHVGDEQQERTACTQTNVQTDYHRHSKDRCLLTLSYTCLFWNQSYLLIMQSLACCESSLNEWHSKSQ